MESGPELINTVLKSKQIQHVVLCKSMTDLFRQHTISADMNANNNTISTRALIPRHNLKLFIQHLLNVFKEYKPNTLDLKPSFSRCNNGRCCLRAFLSLLVLTYKKSPEPTQKRQMASHLIRFQNDNAARR